MFGFGKKKLSVYTDLNTGKYMVVLFRKIGDRYVRIDKSKVTVDKTGSFRYKNHKDFYNFNMNNILFSDDKFNYYGFDYDTGSQLVFEGSKMPKDITLNEVDEYVNRGLIKEIMSDLETEGRGETAKMLMFIILGAVIGGLAGFLIGSNMNITPQILLGVIGLC